VPDEFRIGEGLMVGGELQRRRAGPLWATLRVLLHLSLLFVPWFVLRTLARFFIGLHVRATIRLEADALVVRTERMLVGRRIGDRELSYPYRSVLAAGRAKRYRSLHLLVGILCLVIGGAIGIVAIHDGIAGGYAPLALAGFGLLGLGVVIDLALNILVPTARKRSVVELRLPREDLWLAGVDDDLAVAFVRAALERLSAPRAAASPSSEPPAAP
jgi:hypothetical protein